jgi:hypothetical protein
LMYSSHLCIGFPAVIFPSYFLTKLLYAYLIQIDLKGFWRWCMVYRIHIIFFWTFSNVLYSKKHNVSETGSASVQWLRLALSKGPNWVDVFSPTFTWERKKIQFLKRRFFGIQDDGKSPEKFCEFYISSSPFILHALIRVSIFGEDNKLWW